MSVRRNIFRKFTFEQSWKKKLRKVSSDKKSSSFEGFAFPNWFLHNIEKEAGNKKLDLFFRLRMKEPYSV